MSPNTASARAIDSKVEELDGERRLTSSTVAASSFAATNPLGPLSGEFHITRGGSWKDDAKICRSAYRDIEFPSQTSDFLGFRVVHRIVD